MDAEKESLACSWLLNVTDEFKSKTFEQIVTALNQTKFGAAVAFEHWTHDFNMGAGFRNANGFNMKEIFYIGGKRSWDRRASVGSHHYMDITYAKTFKDFQSLIGDKYTVIGIDNVPGSVCMTDFEWPENALMLFGEEGCGLTEEAQAICRDIVYIPMFGSVRSFNCGVASGIAMYDYITKIKRRLY